MKIHNTRSPEQWEIISRRIDFKGKTVLDLGCGRGDILFRAVEAGAIVAGVDCDEVNIRDIQREADRMGFQSMQLMAIEDDIETLGAYPGVDIIICFSDLPYLIEPESMLNSINLRSDVALIECQYAGDGPGFSFLRGNDDMQEWLLAAGRFEKVTAIGHTIVEGRNTKRFIWMCK